MMAPARRCPTCYTRHTERRCPTCMQANKPQHARFYRGGGFYGRRWRKARAAFLAEHPFCVDCGRLADEVDHVTPHRGDRALFWSSDNWQSLCETCHGRKTARETLHGDGEITGATANGQRRADFSVQVQNGGPVIG